MSPREEMAAAQRALVEALLDPNKPVPDGFDEASVRSAGRSLEAKRARDSERSASRPAVPAKPRWWQRLLSRRT